MPTAFDVVAVSMVAVAGLGEVLLLVCLEVDLTPYLIYFWWPL